MTAGLNLRATIYRKSAQSDDRVGGAVPSGTVVFTNLPVSLSQDRPSMNFASQGRETRTSLVLTTRGSLGDFNGNQTTYEGIQEDDEIVITWPVQSQYYQLRFLVTGEQQSTKRRNRYGHTHVTVERIRKSRLNVYP